MCIEVQMNVVLRFLISQVGTVGPGRQSCAGPTSRLLDTAEATLWGHSGQAAPTLGQDSANEENQV